MIVVLGYPLGSPFALPLALACGDDLLCSTAPLPTPLSTPGKSAPSLSTFSEATSPGVDQRRLLAALSLSTVSEEETSPGFDERRLLRLYCAGAGCSAEGASAATFSPIFCKSADDDVIVETCFVTMLA
eukprot:CAMPEP_0173069906 /NCGR_PEP_ID=MMETSP1102-20130122/8298_1 /TAXON_ID=49646 /ORGANISM="Geminigera sp., Strain Caron Lab Isolate" /LENGTH=128 /DNA_ID=CAMNT_0013938069 /DNA_START=897 /DNA_END=1283 /DNA_ORIENTATION=-